MAETATIKAQRGHALVYVDEVTDVAGKADRHRRRRDDQPADHHPPHGESDPLRHRMARILVLSRRAREHRAELGVTQAGQRTHRCGEEKREPDECARVRRGRAEQDIDTGADDDPHTAGRDLCQAENAAQGCRTRASGTRDRVERPPHLTTRTGTGE